MTVKQMLASLDSMEITEWQGFFLAEKKDQENAKKKAPVESSIKFGMGGYNKHKLPKRRR